MRLSGDVEPYDETWYSGIQEAYNASSNADDILMMGSAFNEHLIFNRNISITLHGGYNVDFDAVTGITTVYGSMTVQRGKATIGSVKIR